MLILIIIKQQNSVRINFLMFVQIALCPDSMSVDVSEVISHTVWVLQFVNPIVKHFIKKQPDM